MKENSIFIINYIFAFLGGEPSSRWSGELWIVKYKKILPKPEMCPFAPPLLSSSFPPPPSPPPPPPPPPFSSSTSSPCSLRNGKN